ncbi:MAG: ACT domain-containing protein [Terriglobia bacterium]
MAVVTQLSVIVENKRGALAELCTKLAEKAVNIAGMMAPDQPGLVPVRVVVNHVDVAKKVFDQLGLKYTEDQVLDVRVSDKPGALGKVTRKLSDNGIDIRFAYATILKGAGQANVILGVSDVEAAAKIVK